MTYQGTFVDGRRVTFSHHALERLVEMQIPAHHIDLTLNHPEVRVPSTKYPGCETYKRGDLALAVESRDGTLVVITALYATRAAWQRAYDAGIATEAVGRCVREDIHLP